MLPIMLHQWQHNSLVDRQLVLCTSDHALADPTPILVLCHECRTLPRIGLHFGVPKQWNQVKWFGAGPHECYWDRKSGAPVREYSSTVQDMHVPYIVPGLDLLLR